MHRTTQSVIILLFLLATMASASTYTVYPDGSGDAATIQAAINDARDGDEIVLADGVFSGEGNWNVDVQGKAIVLRSASGDPERTIVDVQGVHDNFVVERAFLLTSGEGPGTVLRDFTITGGDADGTCPDCQGGAVYVLNSSPTLINMTFRDNFGINGGAMFVEGPEANPVIRNSRFLNNTALTGGAVEIFGEGGASFIKCLFLGNKVEFSGIAGAIRVFNWGTSLYMDRCTVAYNSATLGSAFELYNCTAVFENSIIANNIGGEAFGFTSDADVILRYTLVHDNAGTNWVKEISPFRNRWGNMDLAPMWNIDAAGVASVLLSAGSPAVDAGNPDAPLDPDGTRADLGAFPINQNRGDRVAVRQARTINDRRQISGDNGTAVLPTEFAVGPSYPNPFNGQTRVTVSLPAKSELNVRVLNVLGRQVAQLASGAYSAGEHSFAWTADVGVASGVYLLVVDGGPLGVRTSKLVLTR